MASLSSVTLDVPDAAPAEAFYTEAWDLKDHVGVRAAEPQTSGFRGFTLSLVVPQPGNVDLLAGAAIERGATVLKPVAKSFWGYGGTLQAPDGAIWKIATSSKKDSGPATTDIDDVVLLLGVADVKESKRFYVDHGLTVKRSFGSKYVEFDAAPSELKLGLYGRRALAKDAGVPEDGSGSHRVTVHSDAGSFTDPDGFAWEATGPA